jgi:hypothetical protein
VQQSQTNGFDEDDFFQCEQLTPLARSLASEETWSVDGDGTYYPNIPYSISNDCEQGIPQISSEFQNGSSKKEETYNKMAERQLVGKNSMNPFLDNNSYASDLGSEFLRPVSASQDKVA